MPFLAGNQERFNIYLLFEYDLNKRRNFFFPRFIYYGIFSIPISVEIVLGLFKALVKLEIVGMDATEILNAFASKLDSNNCFEFLDISKLDCGIDLTEFHATVKRWISNNVYQIIRSEKFLDLEFESVSFPQN